MAIMVGNGAQAGALSPVAPTGIIVTGIMNKIGLAGFELRTYLANFLAHALVGVRRLLAVRRLEALHARATTGTVRAGRSRDRDERGALDHAGHDRAWC